MTLRFFADHCVSNLIIHWLERAGHQVLRLKDHLPVESPDTAVMHAGHNRRVLGIRSAAHIAKDTMCLSR
jgi:hypothetical protein